MSPCGVLEQVLTSKRSPSIERLTSTSSPLSASRISSRKSRMKHLAEVCQAQRKRTMCAHSGTLEKGPVLL